MQRKFYCKFSPVFTPKIPRHKPSFPYDHNRHSTALPLRHSDETVSHTTTFISHFLSPLHYLVPPLKMFPISYITTDPSPQHCTTLFHHYHYTALCPSPHSVFVCLFVSLAAASESFVSQNKLNSPWERHETSWTRGLSVSTAPFSDAYTVLPAPYHYVAIVRNYRDKKSSNIETLGEGAPSREPCHWKGNLFFRSFEGVFHFGIFKNTIVSWTGFVNTVFRFDTFWNFRYFYFEQPPEKMTIIAHIYKKIAWKCSVFWLPSHGKFLSSDVKWCAGRQLKDELHLLFSAGHSASCGSE